VAKSQVLGVGSSQASLKGSVPVGCHRGIMVAHAISAASGVQVPRVAPKRTGTDREETDVTDKPTPQQVVDAYLQAVQLAYGDEALKVARLFYSRGWYYLKMPYKVLGHWISSGQYRPLRRSEIGEVTQRLLDRTEGDGK